VLAGPRVARREHHGQGTGPGVPGAEIIEDRLIGGPSRKPPPQRRSTPSTLAASCGSLCSRPTSSRRCGMGGNLPIPCSWACSVDSRSSGRSSASCSGPNVATSNRLIPLEDTPSPSNRGRANKESAAHSKRALMKPGVPPPGLFLFGHPAPQARLLWRWMPSVTVSSAI
jgi:hypothetical protein